MYGSLALPACSSCLSPPPMPSSSSGSTMWMFLLLYLLPRPRFEMPPPRGPSWSKVTCTDRWHVQGAKSSAHLSRPKPVLNAPPTPTSPPAPPGPHPATPPHRRRPPGGQLSVVVSVIPTVAETIVTLVAAAPKKTVTNREGPLPGRQGQATWRPPSRRGLGTC